jgi:hypothetical protein
MKTLFLIVKIKTLIYFFIWTLKNKTFNPNPNPNLNPIEQINLNWNYGAHLLIMHASQWWAPLVLSTHWTRPMWN